MKKLLIIILLIIIPFNVYAYEKKAVTLNKCVDGDTAWFNLNEEKIKARFLAIDTPESTNKIEFFGKEASKYTCNKLKKANKIEIEYDENSNKYDKYNRNLVWVWIDNELLQNLIIENGYGKVAYLYGDYKYTALLKDAFCAVIDIINTPYQSSSMPAAFAILSSSSGPIESISF